jgi:acetyltransferase-like isoleucine patch superfamily enzyme
VVDRGAEIHPSAEVEPDVSVGRGTKVGQRAQVRRGARIGAESIIGRDVLVDLGVTIGDRVNVHDAALLYSGVTVEDDVLIGPGAILTNERFPRAVTSTLDLAAADTPDEPIVVRRGSSVGAGAVVVAGVEIGTYAMVGAGAVVTHDVPGHALVAGNPAQRIGWVCACGRRLKDSTGHDAPAERERYAIDTNLVCESCGRHYAYVPDGETLEERTGPRQGAPA